MNIERELGQKLKEGVKVNEPMSRHTSWQVGGPADYFLCPADTSELKEIVRFGRSRALPLYIFGNGTNLLVLDGGIRGLVVKIGEYFNYVRRSGDRLEAGAGTQMTNLARSAAQEGLAGIEFAAGIPGSLGGAAVMNAGAFGCYIGERIDAVRLISYKGESLTLEREEIKFGYRTSNLPGKGIVVEVILKLKKGHPADSLEMIEHFLRERSLRHPELPSAGSVFRNLPGQPAGKIIEEIGLKGMSIGGAEVSCKHANFIVNNGYATAKDILSLIETVRRKVREECNLELQPEVKIIGEEK